MKISWMIKGQLSACLDPSNKPIADPTPLSADHAPPAPSVVARLTEPGNPATYTPANRDDQGTAQ
ncbi:MAG: hypothetical protein WCI46_15895 [Verrucomicrobiota bacterium]